MEANNKNKHKLFYVENDDLKLISIWNKFVDEKLHSPFGYHSLRLILSNSFKIETFSLLVLDENNSVSGFCLAFFNQKEKILYSFKYGFFAKDEESQKILKNEILAIYRKNNLNKVIISCEQSITNIFKKKIEKITFHIPLLFNDKESLWHSLPPKCKNKIRRAKKNGILTSISWENLEEFYQIYTDHCIHKRLGIKPFSYFEQIRDCLEDKSILICGILDEKVISGMIFIYSKGFAHYIYNSSIKSGVPNGTNNLIMWETMIYFFNKKISYIDLSESKLGSPVYKFKKNLSKKIITKKIYYFIFGNDKHSFLVRLKGNFLSLIEKILPILNAKLKKKILLFKGRSGRLI